MDERPTPVPASGVESPAAEPPWLIRSGLLSMASLGRGQPFLVHHPSQNEVAAQIPVEKFLFVNLGIWVADVDRGMENPSSSASQTFSPSECTTGGGYGRLGLCKTARSISVSSSAHSGSALSSPWISDAVPAARPC